MYITKQDFLFIKVNCFAKLIGLNSDLNAADFAFGAEGPTSSYSSKLE